MDIIYFNEFDAKIAKWQKLVWREYIRMKMFIEEINQRSMNLLLHFNNNCLGYSSFDDFDKLI